MPLFESPAGPTIRDCLEEAREILYRQGVPSPILVTLLESWVSLIEVEPTSAEADGLLWGFVAGRIYTDAMRLAPEFYAHMPNTQ